MLTHSPREIRAGLALSHTPSQNPGVPPLFRDIFNNAYLPYRDPETLRSFLRIIDEFSYEDSESLGDAFEYLLSVLDSQGDAGQFRTPRHIIDFIVAIVDPKKNESVLDPACGTAGFLISSYKHIMAANTGEDGQSRLTPQERGALAENFRGYDISPDMVRLSLVNMYLHGFVAPHIYEYDTLTSDERWNEYADVILANPPFMSPKGGIRPHNRFSVQSKRSEVLFVDYMAEHLSPTGRAGIIVPEGIIFQSQNAHKRLRKMLVEEYLVAVVSLPAGVFQPYSGVKTSVLILDRALAKRTHTIAFFKVENDGFDLGAQRRPIDRSDLPRVQAELAEYLDRQRAGGSLDDFQPSRGLIVEKERIAADDDYNLSGERYRVIVVPKSVYPLVPIGNFYRDGVKSLDPRLTPDDHFELWSIPAFDKRIPEILRGDEIGSAKKVVYPGDVLLSRIIPHIRRAWVVRESPTGYSQIASTEWMVFSSEQIVPAFLQRTVTCDAFHAQFMQTITGVGGSLSRANPRAVTNIEIPLPPLEVQQEIVAEIDGYQKVIDGARAVVENYRPHIVVDPEWPLVALGDVCSLISGQHVNKDDYNTDRTGIGYLTGPADFGEKCTSFSKWTTKPKVIAEEGDVLITVKGSGLGKVNLLGAEKAAIGRQLMAIRSDAAIPEYIYSRLAGMYDHIQSLGNGAAIPGITRDDVLRLQIPLPDLAEQESIIANLDRNMELVNGNRELVMRFEEKIQAVIGRVWGNVGGNGAVDKSRTA